jgi:tetratricopeptide (TPR) repeat protein
MRRNWEIFRRKWALPAELPGEKGYPVPHRMADGERLKIELSDSATIGEASSGSESRTSSGSEEVASMGALDRASTCREDGRPVEAWEAAIEAIRQRPFHPEAYLLMAQVARAAGDEVAAVRAHKRAAALAPGCPAVKQLGQALKSKKDLRKTDLRWPALPEASAEPRLSVCLIVKNEERFLARCLKSVREVASQIVVVDTGSTDRTIEIAREHGAEVHSFTWCDDFSAARNLSLLHARGDWVLILDADEELSGTHVQKLKSHLRTPGVLGFRLPLKESTLGDGALAYVPRLFRNAPGIHFIGRVHEEAFSQVERLGKAWGMEHRRGDALLIHHGYAPEVVAERNKKSRNLRLLRLGIAEHPQNLNYRTQLGLELVRSGDREAGLREYARALAQANASVHGSLTPEAREALLTQYSTYLLQAGRWPEVVEVLRSPLAAAGRLTAGQLLNRGTALIRMRCHTDAARDLREAIARAGETTLYYRPEELSGPLPYLALGQALEGCGEIEAADQAYRTVITRDPDSEEWVREYARFLTGQDRHGDALRMLFEFALRRPDSLAIWQRGAEIALLRPELAGIAEQWCTEARRHHPNDPDLAIAEGAALLQRGRVKEAARALASAPQRMDAPVTAARLMTSLVADEPLPLVAGDQRLAVSRAFLETCQRLYQAGARDTVNSVMQRVDRLRPVLPVVADALEGAGDSSQQKSS